MNLIINKKTYDLIKEKNFTINLRKNGYKAIIF